MEQTHILKTLGVILALIVALGLILIILETRAAPSRLPEDHAEEGDWDTVETLVPIEDEANLGGGGTGPVSTVTPRVTHAYPGEVSGTPTPNPTPIGFENAFIHQDYTVQQGDTLSRIALLFGCTVDELAAANGVSPDAIWPGQVLIVPAAATETAPDLKLIPDSELVYGPAAIHFDVTAFVVGQDGYLASYTEIVEGRTRTGAEIVQLVAQRYSVGPRVLLSLLELKAGWVTNPEPAEETLYYPMGKYEDYLEGLFQQLSWAAAQLNNGYYGWKYRGWTTIRLNDGNRAAIAPEINAGTVAVQNYLGQISHGDTWRQRVGPAGFAATYERLFGNPFGYSVEPLLPSDLAQPELRLPWQEGETWYLTGGPHGGWGQGSGWAALDFAPGGEMGCQVSQEWVTAAAPGLVLRSEEGEVVIDLDGDGYEQSGWVLTYLHVDSQDRVEAGTWIEPGERIGHASCEGGFSIATHLHIARRYNGEWIPAGGPVPMVLSGWTAQADLREYDGSMVKGDEVRVACECSDDAYNGLVSDNALSD